MSVIVVLGYLVPISILWYYITRLIFEERVGADEVHYAPTEDGYEIALYRYRPAKVEPGREPVILCHGLTACHVYWDPGTFPSFARHLAESGFDVFAIDLRGRGLSSKPGGRRPGRLLEWGAWSFDDYVRYDLPAVIKYVRRFTGSKEVHWVGHSMGGMVIYAYLQEHADGGGVKSATAVASPGNITRARQYGPIIRMAPLLLRGRRVYTGKLAKFFTPFAYLIPAERFGMSRRAFPWLTANAVNDVSTGVMRQFYHWAKNSTFCNKGGSVVYSEGFHKIKRPLLTMVGSGDFIAHPAYIKYVADRLDGNNHKHVFFSKKRGSMANYDHMSILMGKTAPVEVYPVITDWLKEHSST